MFMKKFKVLFSTFICLAAIISMFIISTQVSAISKTIDTDLQQLTNSIEKDAISNPELAMSSCPYDYIKNNESFDDIVALGNDALPVLEDKINDSEQSGLQEYILAIAMEKIAKVDFKDGDQEWNNGKGFTERWDYHLQHLESNIQSIISSSDSVAIKNTNLEKLGTPAIPFIMDNISAGNTELEPALQELCEGNSSVTLDENTNIQDWIKNNNSKFDSLRKLVNSKQQ